MSLTQRSPVSFNKGDERHVAYHSFGTSFLLIVENSIEKGDTLSAL